MFKKAERKQVKLKLGITGPSGSGKTMSALLMASAMGKKIAVIDTENGSASLYAGQPGVPEFDTMELEPPYTVDKYIAAINSAVQAGYEVLVVDSVSHVWMAEGGLLQEKEALDGRGGNSYTNWAKMTPKWNRFVSAILHSDIHMLCTMRAKQDYVLELNDKGKQAPKKVGLAPQVREGFEYELTTVFEMDMRHQATASKDRTNLFDDKIFVPSAATGKALMAWLSGGRPTPPAPQPERPLAPPTELASRQAPRPMPAPEPEGPPPAASSDTAPTCECGNTMRVAQFRVKGFEGYPWLCIKCKATRAREVVA